MSADPLPAPLDPTAPEHQAEVVPLGARRPVRLEPAGLARLLDEDPDLGQRVPARFAAVAQRQAVAETARLRRGTWAPGDDPGVAAEDFGLLVLEGALTRRVTIGARRSAELLGPGDLLRPCQPDCDEYAFVARRARYDVLAPTRVARLDRELVAVLASLPGVLPELAGRAIGRSRALALLLAIAQTPNLERRVELTLWHVADRWGRRERDGIAIDVRLPQGLIAELVCAQRTSVNAALQHLEQQGVISSRGTGRWVLRPEPSPEVVAAVAPSA